MALGKREVVTKTASKKESKPVVKVTGKDFALQVNKFKAIKEQISVLTTEKASLEGDVKTACYEEYIKLYKTMHSNPDTIKIETESGDRLMFMVVKKYAGSVDEERASQLRKKYGKTIIEEKSEMIMNNDLLNKYSSQLEELIMGAPFMTADEKESLFVEKVTYSIKSNAIDEGFTAANGNVEELLSDISPVLMLKDAS
jgi:hypothetical protein